MTYFGRRGLEGSLDATTLNPICRGFPAAHREGDGCWSPLQSSQEIRIAHL